MDTLIHSYTTEAHTIMYNSTYTHTLIYEQRGAGRRGEEAGAGEDANAGSREARGRGRCRGGGRCREEDGAGRTPVQGRTPTRGGGRRGEEAGAGEDTDTGRRRRSRGGGGGGLREEKDWLIYKDSSYSRARVQNFRTPAL